jgi:uncharacterized membrane-anchored protein YhcB (DUF1043 family)
VVATLAEAVMQTPSPWLRWALTPKENAMQWFKAAWTAATAFLRAYWRRLVITEIILIGVWLFWWQVPKWQVHGLHIYGKDRGDLEDSFRKTITQSLGGIAILLGAIITYRQFRHQQRTTREQFEQQRKQIEQQREQFQQQQQEQREQFQEQQQAARALLITNQVSKAFEQLASDKLAAGSAASMPSKA